MNIPVDVLEALSLDGALKATTSSLVAEICVLLDLHPRGATYESLYALIGSFLFIYQRGVAEERDKLRGEVIRLMQSSVQPMMIGKVKL